jgi:hypothetical protein
MAQWGRKMSTKVHHGTAAANANGGTWVTQRKTPRAALGMRRAEFFLVRSSTWCRCA